MKITKAINCIFIVLFSFLPLAGCLPDTGGDLETDYEHEDVEFTPSIEDSEIGIDLREGGSSHISSTDLKDYLRQNGSPLADYSDVIIEQCEEYDCDPCLVVAIAMAESTLGTKMPADSYNAWGYFYHGKFHYFQNWENAIRAVAYEFGPDGAQSGKTDIEDLTWCAEECEHWEGNVKAVYNNLASKGCDINDLTFRE